MAWLQAHQLKLGLDLKGGVHLVLRVQTDDGFGWGECAAAQEPRYSEEFNESAWLVLRDHLAPALLKRGELTAEDVGPLLAWVRGHPMAKVTWKHGRRAMPWAVRPGDWIR